MNDRLPGADMTVPIAAVERDTGLSKDTLRVWERRYGFPAPGRDAFGERAYTLAEVDKLRVVKRLLDHGHRPGRIVDLPIERLQELADASPAARRGAAAFAAADALGGYMELVKTHRVIELRRALSQNLLRMGLGRFVADVVGPMNELIGDAWARGRLEVFEEHLYTEAMQSVLRSAISTVPEAGATPRVLLTTLPFEGHGLGLLMAEALLVLDGAHCISLGMQTPIGNIVLAARAQGVDIVALSFSSAHASNAVHEGLAELRRALPAPVELWAGGSSAALQRRPLQHVRVLPALADIGPSLEHWRAGR